MTQKAVVTSNGLIVEDLTETEENEFAQLEVEYQNNLPEKYKTEIRIDREPLFQEADIEINKLEDAGQDASAWRTYRQELRDMTEQSDLVNPVYPTKPSLS